MGRCGEPLLGFIPIRIPPLYEILWNMGAILFSGVAWAINVLYQIFAAVATANLFNAEIIENFARRITMILGVVMFFVILINLIRMVSDPDRLTNTGEGSGRDLFKGIIVSLVLLVTVNFIFDIGYTVQRSVLKDNVIGRLFLGNVTGSNNAIENTNDQANFNFNEKMSNAGKEVSIAILDSFLYIKPNAQEGTNSDTVVSTPIDQIGEEGEGLIGVEQDGQIIRMNKETFINEVKAQGFDLLFAVSCDTIRGVVEFPWVLAVVASLAVIYIMVVYIIDLGIRVAKLVFYQLIAPIPIGFRAVPGKRDIFNNWVKETLGVFLEVFVRLAVMFFAITAIQVLNAAFSNTLANSGVGLWPAGDDAPSGAIRLFARSIILLGIILFMKESPKLIGDVFGLKSGGSGNLGLGLNKLKENVKPAATLGKFGMKAGNRLGGAGLGALGAAASAARNLWKEGRFDRNSLNNPNSLRRNQFGDNLRHLGRATRDVLGGAATGARTGFGTGVRGAYASGRGAAEGAAEAKEAMRKRAAENGRTVFGQRIRDYMTNAKAQADKRKAENYEAAKEAERARRDRRTPTQIAADAQALEQMNQIMNTASQIANANQNVIEAEKRAAQAKADAHALSATETAAVDELNNLEAQEATITGSLNLAEILSGQGAGAYFAQREASNNEKIAAIDKELKELNSNPKTPENDEKIREATSRRESLVQENDRIQKADKGSTTEKFSEYVNSQLASNADERTKASAEIARLETAKAAETDQAKIREIDDQISFQKEYVAELNIDDSKLKAMKDSVGNGVIEFAAELKDIDLSKGAAAMQDIKVQASAAITNYQSQIASGSLTLEAKQEVELKLEGAKQIQAQITNMENAGITMNLPSEMEQQVVIIQQEKEKQKQIIKDTKTEKDKATAQLEKAEQIVEITKREAINNSPTAVKGLEKMRKLVSENNDPKFIAKLAEYGVDINDLGNTLTADTLFKVKHGTGTTGERLVTERFEDVIQSGLSGAKKILEAVQKPEKKPEANKKEGDK